MKAGTYTFSIDSPISTNTLTLALKGASWHNFTIAKNGTSATLTLDEDIDTISITTGGFSSGTAINFTIHIMLNEGSTALPYEPYGTNEWYLEKKIGKVVLDGNNSSLASGGTSTSGYNRWRVTLDKPKPTSSTSEISQVFSDKLIGVSAGNTWNRIQGISIDTSNNYSFFYIEEVATYTLNNFKTWLTNNPITLYYQYSSPTYTQITGTLKDELEALQKAQSYKGTTNINQINNDLPFNMNVSVKVGN